MPREGQLHHYVKGILPPYLGARLLLWLRPSFMNLYLDRLPQKEPVGKMMRCSRPPSSSAAPIKEMLDLGSRLLIFHV